MSHIKVLLVGPYPPPYGGMATQIYEWHRYLTKLETFECAILNIGESRKANLEGCIAVHGYWDFLRKLYRFASRGYIIHLVTNGHNLKSWLSALICTIAGYFNDRKTLIVLGSGNLPVYLRQASGWIRLLVRVVVPLAGIVVCRNDNMQQALIGIGADPKRIVILSGFLSVDSLRHSPVPDKIQVFLDSHYPLLGATVYVPQVGTLLPEYGIPLVMSALQEIRESHPRAGAVIIGPGPEIQDQIEGIDGFSKLCFFTGPLSHEIVLGIMKQLTIFLRPTYFDGDSLSVREALALGIPVVATDTDFRPDGVIKFRKGNIQDLVAKLLYTLENRAELSANAKRRAPGDTAERILRLYDELIAVTDQDKQNEAVNKRNKRVSSR